MFKKASTKADSFLKAAGYSVSINAERPRKGSFVITLEKCGKKQTIVNLLDMPRPFKKLREADLDTLLQAGVDSFAK